MTNLLKRRVLLHLKSAIIIRGILKKFKSIPKTLQIAL